MNGGTEEDGEGVKVEEGGTLPYGCKIVQLKKTNSFSLLLLTLLCTKYTERLHDFDFNF